MDLRNTLIKENYPRNIFFLVDEEAEKQSLRGKDKSRKNKKNQCVLGEKVGTTGSNHIFFRFCL